MGSGMSHELVEDGMGYGIVWVCAFFFTGTWKGKERPGEKEEIEGQEERRVD